jgi:hypothetical protein
MQSWCALGVGCLYDFVFWVVVHLFVLYSFLNEMTAQFCTFERKKELVQSKNGLDISVSKTKLISKKWDLAQLVSQKGLLFFQPL